jgi:hypothetical protein
MTGFQDKMFLSVFINACYQAKLHMGYDSRSEPDLPPYILAHIQHYKFAPDCPQSNIESGRGPKPQLSFLDALAMSLYQYRQAPPFYMLALPFGVSETVANDTFKNISNGPLHILTAGDTDGGCATFMMEVNEDNFASWRKMSAFDDFPNLVYVGDCTEIFCQTPDGSIFKKIIFSNYKHHSTVKLLVIMDVPGNIIYVSEPYGGHISDAQICTANSRIFSTLWPGSQMMFDKGFTSLSSLCDEFGVETIIPPRLNIREKFSAESLDRGRDIAQSRIHVERAIARAKIFQYLYKPVTVATLANYSIPARVCFYLSNFVAPLVHEMSDDQDIVTLSSRSRINAVADMILYLALAVVVANLLRPTGAAMNDTRRVVRTVDVSERKLNIQNASYVTRRVHNVISAL